MVRLPQLALLLQDLLLKLRISWIWYPAVSAETFMANNCVPLLGSTGTLWRPSITINSVPMLWQGVRWQLHQLAADLVRYWVLRVLQLAVLLQDSLLKLNIRLSFCRTSLLETSMVTHLPPSSLVCPCCGRALDGSCNNWLLTWSLTGS